MATDHAEISIMVNMRSGTWLWWCCGDAAHAVSTERMKQATIFSQLHLTCTYAQGPCSVSAQSTALSTNAPINSFP